jgi:Holliday junction resolvasome RuvABC endonuclease subunit
MVVFGCDPGDSSFGMSILSFEANIPKIKFIGMNTKTLSNLTSNTKLPVKSKRRVKQPDIRVSPFIDQLYDFKTNIKRIIKTNGIDLIATERFMTRGIKGKSIECVSMMNGIIASLALDKNIPFILYSAAGWKNSINKELDLKEFYKECKHLKPHEIDASFIALTAYQKFNNIDWSTPLSKKLIKILRKELEVHVNTL